MTLSKTVKGWVDKHKKLEKKLNYSSKSRKGYVPPKKGDPDIYDRVLKGKM